MNYFKRADFFVIILLLLLAAGLLLPQAFARDKWEAVICVDGQIYETVRLGAAEAAYTIQPDCDPPLTITCYGDAIAFTRADCPDKRCVQCGTLSRPGQTAACLPARTVIYIRGANIGGPDAITY